jgi:hypothetical protein
MKKILILLAILCLTHYTQAQTAEQNRMAYYLAHKDSISQEFIRRIFQVKNKDGEMLETFGKRQLRNQYNDYFFSGKNGKPDVEKLKIFVQTSKFSRISSRVKKQFLKDKYFRKSFISTWHNSHAVINEIVCSKKEYQYLVEKALDSKNLYFTHLMYPSIMEFFQVAW